jgi:hypothetical protein
MAINQPTNTNRRTLFTSRYASEAFAELDRLAALYLATQRRALTVDLYFSVEGEFNTARYSVTVYYGAQSAEVEWLVENVMGSSNS